AEDALERGEEGGEDAPRRPGQEEQRGEAEGERALDERAQGVERLLVQVYHNAADEEQRAAIRPLERADRGHSDGDQEDQHREERNQRVVVDGGRAGSALVR